MGALGLLGKSLSHSKSKEIHSFFLQEKYDLLEVEEGELSPLLQDTYDGFNVTIPYKEKIIPFLEELSEEAKEIQAVNTIHLEEGKWKGYNTDALAFEQCLRHKGFPVENKEILVLGTGGASKAVQYVLEKMGAKVILVSRTRKDHAITYKEIHQVSYQAIVNTTPVGMFPKLTESPISRHYLESCEWVVDIIANPLRTKFLQEAKCPSFGGLEMLVRQAALADKIFRGVEVSESLIQSCLQSLQSQQRNLVLIGMAASGKSTIAKSLDYPYFDLDEEISKLESKSIQEIFEDKSEEYFRSLEEKVALSLAQKQGVIIATGGGTILSEKAMQSLRANGFVVWLKRDIDKMILGKDRPLYQDLSSIEKKYRERMPLYEKYADAILENNDSIERCIEEIKEIYL